MSWLTCRDSSPMVARRSASRIAGRAESQAVRQVAEQPGQSADFVRAGIEIDIEAIEIEHGRLFGEGRQRPADSRRHPHRQQQRGDAGSRGGQEKP